MHCRTGPAYPHDRAYTLSCRLFSTSTIYYTIGKKKTQLFFCSLQKIQTSPGLPAPKPRLCRRSALHPALIQDSVLVLGFMERCTPPNPQGYAGRYAPLHPALPFLCERKPSPTKLGYEKAHLRGAEVSPASFRPFLSPERDHGGLGAGSAP